MGRHDSPELFPSPPVRRLTSARARPSADRTVPGLRFPIVDDLSAIAADDRFLDYLAAGRADLASSAVFSTSGSTALAVAPLLATWRSEVVDTPLPALPTLAPPKRVMRGPADRAQTRSLRPILGVAVAICALLVGSAAVGAHSAQPGDALWPLTRVLYASHAQSVQAKVAVTNSIHQAQKFLDNKQATRAKVPLSSADVEITRVDPSDGRESLKTDLNRLWVEVKKRTGGADDSPTEPATAAGRAAAAGVAAAESAKNNGGAGKHSSASNAAGVAGPKANSSKPSSTATNGAADPTQPGGAARTQPGDPLPAPVASSGHDSSNPGGGAATSQSTAPGPTSPAPTDASSAPDPGTSTSSEAPVTTDPSTSADPATSTNDEPPSTAASTTSQMPAPTTDGAGGDQPGGNGPASVADNAQASQ